MWYLILVLVFLWLLGVVFAAFLIMLEEGLTLAPVEGCRWKILSGWYYVLVCRKGGCL